MALYYQMYYIKTEIKRPELIMSNTNISREVVIRQPGRGGVGDGGIGVGGISGRSTDPLFV